MHYSNEIFLFIARGNILSNDGEDVNEGWGHGRHVRTTCGHDDGGDKRKGE